MPRKIQTYVFVAKLSWYQHAYGPKYFYDHENVAKYEIIF